MRSKDKLWSPEKTQVAELCEDKNCRLFYDELQELYFIVKKEADGSVLHTKETELLKSRSISQVHDFIKNLDNSFISREDFYLYDRPDLEERTKKRLTQISDMGMTEVGIAQFGVHGIMSGLYIEKVWNYSDEDWNGYIEWAQTLIDERRNKLNNNK